MHTLCSTLHSVTSFIEVWEQKLQINSRSILCMKVMPSEARLKNFSLKNCIFRAYIR